MQPLNILVIGASYGALIASKVSLAGHRVTLAGRPEELSAIARDGMRVDLPVRRLGGNRVLSFEARPGPSDTPSVWGLQAPEEVDAHQFDLAFLVVQEPQLGDKGLLLLLEKIAASALPVASLMNMPPLSYLRHVPGLDPSDFSDLYASAEAWDILRDVPQTLASPDPQAYRPDIAAPGNLRVTLATNFRCAPFADAAAQAILTRLAHEIADARPEGWDLPVPVRLVVSDHAAVPLTKLPMLACGNYRCVSPSAIRSIECAVWDDQDLSREIYDWGLEVLSAHGVPETLLVPFERYAEAARALSLPSSAARAIDQGATQIERADLFLLRLAELKGMPAGRMRAIANTISARLRDNTPRQTCARRTAT